MHKLSERDSSHKEEDLFYLFIFAPRYILCCVYAHAKWERGASKYMILYKHRMREIPVLDKMN